MPHRAADRPSTPTGRRPRPRATAGPLLRLLALAAFALLVLISPAAASAAGSPAITLNADVPGQLMFGKTATVNLTASNPAGQPYGYNLSFRDVLPAGVSYVPGSASFAGAALDPQVIVANAGTVSETTTLIWRNVGDLSANSAGTLTYKVAHATTGINAFSVAGAKASYSQQPSAYINTDPRTVPAFTAAGVYSSGATGQDTPAAKTTSISAIAVSVGEGSPEGKLLRGAHDHQTVYTLHLDNNTVNPTGPLTLDAYLPAGLEFLGCGDSDNTTDAPTNPGAREEWPGAGALSGRTAAPAGCAAPSSVTTFNGDPDGAGPLPAAIYTKVTWTGLATLAAGASRDIRYVAAVPMRANTATFAGGAPTGASLKQGANLDNNNGARTQDGQKLTTYAVVSGNYNGVTPVSASDSLDRTAKDLRVLKSASQGTIAYGQLTRWTLALATGEYRYVDNIRVTDTVPNGLCPLDSANLESDSTAECAPTAGGHPTAPYAGYAEHADGSWTLAWDQTSDPALTRMQPSATHAIQFTTRARSHYQRNGADDKPVLARDGWTNTVAVLGAGYQRCVPQADCGLFSTKIDTGIGLPPETGLDGADHSDTSSAGQSAGAPSIDKAIRAAGAAPANCAGGSYGDGPAGPYGPGDRVCYRLRIDFPGVVDTGRPQVVDFLPPGVTFESATPTANNTVTIKSTTVATGNAVITWTLGNAADNAASGTVFEVLVAARVADATAGQALEVKGNLMKFSFADSPGQSFPMRDQADFTWAEPNVTLTEGVRAINNKPAAGNPADTDGGTVQAGDVVSIRIDVANTGNRDATGAVIWERLPAGVSCADTAAISAGGACNAGVITWTGVSLAANASKTLTYDYTIPAGARPATGYDHHAGVRTFQSADNTGATFTYYPANNIDPAVTAGQVNAPAADDTTNVATAAPTVTYTSRSDDINQSGNATPNSLNATIGERISYTATATIPAGTTLQDTAGPATLTIPVGTKQTIVPGSVTVTLNGTPVTPPFAVSSAGNTITVTFPANHVTPAGPSAATLQVTYQATVDNVAANKRTAGQSIATTATLRYANGAGAQQTPNQSATQTIVEPNLTAAVANNSAGGRVSPGQTVRYTVTLTNPNTTRASAANDVVAVVTVPVGLTPVDGSGDPVADGDDVPPSAGAWNAGARTITYTRATLDVNATATVSYDVKVDDPQVGNATKQTDVVATATSYPSSATLYGTLRDAVSAAAQGAAGYRSAPSNTVRLIGATLTKAVDAATATVGQQRAYTLNVTVPAATNLYDITVRDLLPDGMVYEPGSFMAVCVGGCDLDATAIAPTSNGDGSTQLGFFIGDVAHAAAERVVRITYTAHVANSYRSGAAVTKGNTLVNSAAVHSNQTDAIAGTPATVPAAGSFSDASTPQTQTVTVTEPTLTVDKRVSGQVGDSDTRDAQPGDSFTYTVAVTNSGNATAYDVEVSDRPDRELVNVTPAGGQSTGDLVDGWTAGDPDMRWNIASISAGQTVTLTYTADLDASANLHATDVATNTADVPAYFGRPQAERTANGFDYRPYGTGAWDVPADTVAVNVRLPRLAVAVTTDRATAEVGQDFPWRVTVANVSATADAKNADLSVRLPRNWTYTPGSAVGGGGEPTVNTDAVNGDLLTWTDFTDLPAAGNKVVTFNAKPTLDAKTDAGLGASNPHVARATVTADDASGASASADGPYVAGPDTAQTVLTAPDLAITKTPDNGTATAGSVAAWTVKVTNNGDGTARGVRVTDTLPAGVSYTAGTASSANAGFAEVSNDRNPDGTRTVVFALGNLAPGGSATITVPAAVAAGDDPGTTYTNTATVRADEQPDGPTDTGSFVVATSADVGVTKTAGAGRFVAGEDVSWTLETTNAGPSDARDVQLADPVPAGVTAVTVDGADADACTVTAVALDCDFGTVAAGEHRTVTLHGHLDAAATGMLANTAKVTTSTSDPVAANNAGVASTPVDEHADLKLTKTADKATVLQGTDVTYAITVKNLGSSDARNVVVTDPLPAGTSYVSDDASCTHAAGTVACQLGTVAAGASRTLHITATVNTTGTKTNAATVTTTADDPTPANDTDTATVAVDPAVDLAVAKSAAANVAADGVITYTLDVINHGPSAATGVTVTDTLPAGTTFVAFDAPAAWTCTTPAVGEHGTVSCERPSLASGAAGTLTLKVRAGFGLAAQDVTNTATVSGPDTDPQPGNNTASATVHVGPASDLKLTKSASPDPVVQTKHVTYTLTVNNLGGQDDTGVVVTDTLPAGISYVSDDAGCTAAGQTVTCTVGDLAAGDSATINLVAQADEPGNLQNTATVSGDNPDPDTDNNTAGVEVTVRPAVDLAVKKTGPADVTAGGEATYTLTVSNGGPSPATGVTLTDTLPDGLSYVSDDAGCDHARATVSCRLDDLAKGDTATVHITARAAHTAAEKTLTNTATVTGDRDELDGADNTDSTDTTVGPSADLSIVKTADPDSVPQNRDAAYTLTVTNHGPSKATDVVITDELPAGVTFRAIDAGEATCTTPAVGETGTITCTLAELSNGDSVAVKVTVRGKSVGAHTNTATVTATEPDGDPDNNQASADLDIGPTADLSVTKTGPATVTAGGQATYTLTARNDGPSDAHHVAITDTLPDGLQFVAAAEPDGAGHTVAGQTVTFELGELAAGDSVQVTVTARATFAAAGSTVINTAHVSADENDNDPSDNDAAATTQVGPAADLSIVNTAPAHVPAEGTLMYTLQVANRGPQTATGVTVADTLPDGLQLASADATQGACRNDGRAVTCALGAMPAGGSAQVLIAATVDADMVGRDISNVATVRGEQPDPNTDNNTSSASTHVELPIRTAGSLSVTKTADGDARVAQLGRPLGFTITVRNDTDRPATGVVAIDRPSAPVGVVSAKTERGRCNIKTLRCDIGTMQVGEVVRIRVVMTPKQTGPLRNSVTVASDQGDRDASDNVDHANVKVRASKTTFKLTKTAARRTVNAGAKVRFAIRATNTGKRAAAHVRVCDVPGNGLSFVRVRGAKLTRGRACWSVAYWKAGQTRTFRVLARVHRNGAARATNRATLTAANARTSRRKATVRLIGAGVRRGGGVTG